MGSLLIHNITAKLTAGWNPWVNAEKSRQFTEIPIIFSRYRDYVKTMTDKNAMKEKNSIDYLSRIKMLETFIAERSDIRNIAQKDKFRDPLTEGALKKLKAYLNEHNKNFLLACLFEHPGHCYKENHVFRAFARKTYLGAMKSRHFAGSDPEAGDAKCVVLRQVFHTHGLEPPDFIVVSRDSKGKNSPLSAIAPPPRPYARARFKKLGFLSYHELTTSGSTGRLLYLMKTWVCSVIC